jgi:hypothetical protein
MEWERRHEEFWEPIPAKISREHEKRDIMRSTAIRNESQNVLEKQLEVF